MKDESICARDGCGRKIDHQQYVSKGNMSFCSLECASGDNAKPDFSPVSGGSGVAMEWQILPAPSF